MGYWVAGLILAPVLLFQGKRVRRRVPRLSEPDGPRSGTSGVGPAIRILLLGDSAAASVGAVQPQTTLIANVVNALAENFEVHWQVVAKTGATTADTVHSLKALNIGDVDVAICVLGVNDVISGTSLGKWRAMQNELRHVLYNRLQTRSIIVCGLPQMNKFPSLPAPLSWYLGSRAHRFSTAIARDLCTDANAMFFALDFANDPDHMASDGFHPGPQIYSDWGARLARQIVRIHRM